MKPDNTLYRGERLVAGNGRTLRPFVSANGRELAPEVLQQVLGYKPGGFEWGYHGAGPQRLALALILDATGSLELATRAYHWFMAGPVCCWGSTWQITAGEIREWLVQFERECVEEPDQEDEDTCFVVADPEQHSVYHGQLYCPGCKRVADEVEWPTRGGIRVCPTCVETRGPRVLPVPLAVGKEGAA